MKTLRHIFKTGNSLVKEIRCTMLHCDLMWANFTRDNLDEQTQTPAKMPLTMKTWNIYDHTYSLMYNYS